jgi:hypothetical protein
MRVSTVVLGGVLGVATAFGGSVVLAKDEGKGPLPKIAKPEGVKALTTVKPQDGFVEDAFAFDGSGGRLAWVRADAAGQSEVNVIDLAQGGATLAKVDVSATTTWVTRVAFVLDGSKIAVVGRTPDELRMVGGLYDLGGKKLRDFGPATDVALAEVGGEPVAAVFDELQNDKGKTWEITVVRLKDGKTLGKKRTFKSDADGFVKELDMRVLYFQRGYTQIIGLKKGAYDKIKDQRLNDSQGVYDVVEGRVVKNTPIQDLIGHAKLVKLRQAHQNLRRFLRVADDGRGLELVTEDDARVAVATKELSFDHYVSDSLVWSEARDGRIWFTLTVDPVNPEAVNKKKADPEHIDLYVLDGKGATARRVARIAKNDRPFVWAVAGGRWAVLRKHKGQDRGGPDLEILELTAAK